MEPREKWNWTVMMMHPTYVTMKIFSRAMGEIRSKKKELSPSALSLARLESFREGNSAQIMHIGPYSNESQTIQKLHDFILEKSCELGGKHHEIYLGDPRRTAPSRLRTILR